MGKYTEITIGGQVESKHRRDVAKDEVLRSFLPDPPAQIFEASAGSALFSRELADNGYEVTISNYVVQDVPGVDEHQVDLNDSIPLLESQFDVVLCREVIEHVESVPHTLREFSRILRPGGLLLLTFPNRLHIRSRWYHFLTGFYRGMKSPINLDVPYGEAHINLIGYPEMDYFLRNTGFEPEAVTASYYQGSDKLFLVLRPLIRLATNYYLFHYKKDAEEHEKTKPENIAYNRKIRDILLSTPLFVGKDVIIAARKLG